ncbi:MAG TPA: hypothetical protein VJ939_01420 [Bacteroidales bacterium]|nr:hypothetical protein [Bacteroidales bacterium]
MSKRDKRLKKWMFDTPTTVPKNELVSIVKYFFPNNWRMERTSHLIVWHEDLKQFKQYLPYGEITLPCSKGQQYKGRYVKELVKAIELLGYWSPEEVKK